jgi:DNA-binding CsgD family transcriptional regulator
MSKSELLRVEDVRQAFRLIGDCRDLGSDPILWFPRMLEGLCTLIGAATATGGEGRWNHSRAAIEPVSAFHFGLEPIAYERYVAHQRRGGPAVDPVFSRLQTSEDELITRTRRQLVSDEDWYGSEVFNHQFRIMGIDHRLASLRRAPTSGAVCGIDVDRPLRDGDFSPREQRLLNFFHEEIGRLIGRALVSARDPSPDSLSPRLRQTLACLLEGDSEKQVAARLGLSRATAHQYVTALHRRFGVRSRGELFAYVMKRKSRWAALWPGVSPTADDRFL